VYYTGYEEDDPNAQALKRNVENNVDSASNLKKSHLHKYNEENESI